MACTLDSSSQLSLSINISAVNFGEQDFVDRFSSSCAYSGIHPSRITLEVTESGTVEPSAVTMDVLTRLRIKGFRLSIDDFGTGFSNLRQLADLPFSEIKIDQSFVLSMNRSSDSMAIVKSTIQLGKQLGLVTVAEGVEDMEAVRRLVAFGCEEGQGFYFGRPMGAGDARHFIEMWHHEDRMPRPRSI